MDWCGSIIHISACRPRIKGDFSDRGSDFFEISRSDGPQAKGEKGAGEWKLMSTGSMIM